ncbi:MAG: inositol monophosphatase family protein, partial [Gemmatimonadota bacterium]
MGAATRTRTLRRNTIATTSQPDPAKVERAIQRALLAGGRHARYAFRSRDFRIDWKQDGSPVTSADLEVERIVTDVLREEMPRVPVIGEESAGARGWTARGDAEPLFAVDPIDGTTNFVRGVPFFSVTCAYLEGSETRVGGVYDPVHDDYFHAWTGGGAWWNDRRAAPEPVREIERAEVGLPFDTFPDEWRARAVERLLPRVYKVRALRSAALEICGVGCGRFSAALLGRVAVWD